MRGFDLFMKIVLPTKSVAGQDFPVNHAIKGRMYEVYISTKCSINEAIYEACISNKHSTSGTTYEVCISIDSSICGMIYEVYISPGVHQARKSCHFYRERRR